MKKSRLIPLLTGAAAVAAVTGGAVLSTTSHSASLSATTVAQVSVASGQSVGGTLNGNSGATAATADAQAKADAAVVAYWTPARMRTARDADVLTAKPSTAAQPTVADQGAAQSVAPIAPTGRTAAAASGSRATGKVFFDEGGQRWVCSGSVIRSHRMNVVSTAGHCVIDAGANHYHSNWIFVPDYRNGVKPYGTWVGAYARTTVGWARHGDFDYDAAFVNVHDLNRRHLQNVVGGEGILINQGYKPYITVIGYPQAKPYNGATQQFCYGYTHRYYHTGEIELGCHLTGGASGGPWLRWFSKGYGYVDGVSSNKNSNNNKDIRSPYFGSWTWKMYKQSA